MESYYECKRCLYRTNKIYNIKGHLNRINKCEKSPLNLFKYSDEELYKLSLIKHINNDNNDNNEDKKDDKKFICEKCNMNFTTKGNLKRHITNTCKNKDNNNNTIYNGNVNNINGNVINNIQHNINIQLINPFKSEWSSDHIDVNDKYDILKNNYLYKTTLEKILENDTNLNVLIENEIGYVYNNNSIDKMNVKDVVRRILEKINTTINNFCNEIKKSEIDKDIDIINEAVYISDVNFNNYRANNNNFQDKAKKMITNIYGNKSDKTRKIFEQIKNSSDLNNDSDFF